MLVQSIKDFVYANYPKLIKIVTTKTTNTADMEKIRNNLKMKHALLGAMGWDSLLPSFQLEIIGDEEKN